MRIAPHGPKNPRIAVVGEAAGQMEEVTGMFFVGPSGQTQDSLMRTAGIARSEVYFTNIYKDRPPNNDFSSMFYNSMGRPTPQLLSLYDELQGELQQVNPTVIVAAGNEALRALTGKDGIYNWRGSIMETPVGKVIPTIHPSAIIRASDDGKNSYADLWARGVFDWHKIAREQHFPECRLPNPTLLTSPTMAQVLSFFNEVGAMKGFTNSRIPKDNDPIVALDIETVNQEIDCIGFSHNKDFAICIPFMTMDGSPYWRKEDEARIWFEISKLLGNPYIGKVLQNANYDLTYLTRHGCSFDNLAMDTMNAHHACYPSTPKGLDFLCSIYTRYNYYKDQNNVNRWRYNALDAVVTRECYDAIRQELIDLGTHDLYFGVDNDENYFFPQINKLVLPYKDVADTGIKIDVPMKERIAKDLEFRLYEITNKIKGYVGHEINLASSTQVKKLLYEEMSLVPVKNRKTKQDTTDDKALESLLNKYAKNKDGKIYDILTTIQEHREIHKELTTYARAAIDPDNRCRTTFVVSGAETGRLSSRKAITETGANLQNVTKGELFEGCGYGIRSYFIPDKPGDVFIEGDLSGADARIVAWLSQDPGLLYIFSNGLDIHIENAAIFFGKTYDEVKQRIKSGDHEAKEWRQIAKKCGHAANYGIGVRTLAKNLKVPEREAQRLLNAYLNQYLGVTSWHNEVQKQLKETRTLRTPLGRQDTFFDRWGEELFKKGYAYVPQSTVADIIHIGFLRLYYRIKREGLDKKGVRVALNIHDAITCNTPAYLAQRTLRIMHECMHIPLVFPHGTEMVPVEFSQGPNWHDMKKVEVA